MGDEIYSVGGGFSKQVARRGNRRLPGRGAGEQHSREVEQPEQRMHGIFLEW